METLKNEKVPFSLERKTFPLEPIKLFMHGVENPPDLFEYLPLKLIVSFPIYTILPLKDLFCVYLCICACEYTCVYMCVEARGWY